MSRFAERISQSLALGLLASSASGQEPARNDYEFACETASGNFRSDENVCVAFEFSDGTNEISAGMATTNRFGDFGGTLWRLSEGVRLAFGTTEILADEALLQFEDDELLQGELTGAPVVMSDYIEERETPVSGTARSLSYDSRSGMVHLTGQATLAIGDNEIMACDWIYNVNDKSFDAGTSDDCEGVRGRLAPPEERDDPEGPPGPP